MVDGVERVENRERVLKNRLHFAPVVELLLARKRPDVLTAINDVADGRRDEAEQKHRQRRLSAAALAGDGEDRRLVLLEPQREVRQGDGRLRTDEASAENLGDVPDFEQRGHGSSLGGIE